MIVLNFLINQVSIYYLSDVWLTPQHIPLTWQRDLHLSCAFKYPLSTRELELGVFVPYSNEGTQMATSSVFSFTLKLTIYTSQTFLFYTWLTYHKFHNRVHQPTTSRSFFFRSRTCRGISPYGNLFWYHKRHPTWSYKESETTALKSLNFYVVIPNSLINQVLIYYLFDMWLTSHLSLSYFSVCTTGIQKPNDPD